MQHLLVLILVAGCLSFVTRQAWASLRGRKSKLGNCCSKGCEPTPRASGERVVFLPSDMLRKRK